MPIVEVAGGELWYEEEGVGDPLLLIQGLGQSSWVSRFHRAGLVERWRTIVFDNRGTGRSSKPPGPYSIEQHADDAVAILDALGMDQAHVLGHSMGGYIAQALALRHPERVRSLVLVGTSAGAPTHAPVPRETLDAWLANADRPPEAFARATAFLSFAPGWTDEHPDEYEAFLTARLEHPTPPECFRAQLDATTVWLEAGAPVEKIMAPTLVVHGDADRVVPIANGRGVAARIPRARLAVVPGAGHYVMLEDPDGFNALVARFLEDVA